MTPLRNLLAALCILSLHGCATIDPAEFFHGRKYEKDKPFRMKGANLDAPLLSKKGDAVFGVSGVDGTQILGAWALGSWLGVLMNYSTVSTEESSTGSAWLHVTWSDGTVEYTNVPYSLRHKGSEETVGFGLLHFNSFGSSGRSEQLLGVIRGNADNRHEYVVEKEGKVYGYGLYNFVESRVWWQYYVQQNIGFVTRGWEGAVMARMSYMNFTSQEFVDTYAIEHYTMAKEQWIVQPGVKLGCGWKKVRFSLQCNFNLPLQGDVQWVGTQIKAGIVVRLGSPKSATVTRSINIP